MPLKSKSKAKQDKPKVTGQAVTTVNLDLFNVPLGLKLYKPVNADKGSGFRNACPECLVPVSMPKHCGDHGELTDIVKIVQAGGQNILITDEDMELLEMPTLENFVVEACVPLKDVEVKLSYSPAMYYTVPADSGSKLVYSGLMRSLKKAKSVLIGKFTLRSSRELLGVLTTIDNVIVLRTLPFADAMRPLPEFDLPDADAITTGIGQLLQRFPTTFDYETITDNYSEAVEAMTEKKIQEKLTGTKAKRGKKKEATVLPEGESKTLAAIEASIAMFKTPAKV